MFRNFVLSVAILMVLLTPGWPVLQPRTAKAAILPELTTQSTTALPGSKCVNDWYVSYSGLSNYTLLWTDPDAIPIENLRFDYGYQDPFAQRQGNLNFDADFYSDVFSTVVRPDGALQWRFWDSNSSGWNNLAYAYDQLNMLRFGDFEGDARTDVFTVHLRGDGAYQWLMSDNGTSSFKQLGYSDFSIDRLRFGDFNKDSKTDVFAAFPQPGGVYYQWVYSSGGIGNFTPFYSIGGKDSVDVNSLAFGDVQGPLGSASDGATDIFQILPNGGPLGNGSPEYAWLSPTTSSYSDPAGGVNLSDLRFGNFDGDLYTDIFFMTQIQDGLWQWKYISGKDSTVHILAYAPQPLDQLRLGQFNTDKLTDIFTVQRRCQMWIPLIAN